MKNAKQINKRDDDGKKSDNLGKKMWGWIQDNESNQAINISTKPPRLNHGDKVAIVSPSAGLPFVFPWVYEQGLERMKGVYKLTPIEFPSARKTPEYLSKNPKARAQDINNAFADPSIKAIIATIGGNDQIRILPYLDQKIIKDNPKIFMGYSDCTNLHLFLWNLGIVSYYGGAIMTQFAMGGGMQDYTVESIKKALFDEVIGEVFPSMEYSDVDLDWAEKKNLSIKREQYPCSGWQWHNNKGGIIRGKLWGGCLETLSMHLAVKKYLPDLNQLNDTILFIETSEEMPAEGYIYRFIASLAELGILKRFKAILMAIPKAQYCGMLPPEGRGVFIANQQSAVKSALSDYNSEIPVVFGLNFGHTDPQLIIPSGGMATLDGDKKTIYFD